MRVVVPFVVVCAFLFLVLLVTRRFWWWYWGVDRIAADVRRVREFLDRIEPRL